MLPKLRRLERARSGISLAVGPGIEVPLAQLKRMKIRAWHTWLPSVIPYQEDYIQSVMVMEVGLALEMNLKILLLQPSLARTSALHMSLRLLHTPSQIQPLYLLATSPTRRMLVLMSNICGIACGLHTTGATEENTKRSGAVCTNGSEMAYRE